MQNWSTDETELAKDKKAHAIWRLEQLVNFGLGGEKVREAELREHWAELNLDPARRAFLSLLLYGE